MNTRYEKCQSTATKQDSNIFTFLNFDFYYYFTLHSMIHITPQITEPFISIKSVSLICLFLVHVNIKYHFITAQALFHFGNKDISVSASNHKSSYVSFDHQRLKKLFTISSKDFPTIHIFDGNECKEEASDQIILKNLNYKDEKEEETCRVNKKIFIHFRSIYKI